MLLLYFSLLLSAALFAQLGFAQVRTAGVSEGNWFRYGFTFEYTGELNATSEEFPFAEFMEGDSVTLEIQEISGTNVTGQFTIHFENGTEHFQNASVDLVTGEGDLRNWVVAANLNANDSLYTSEINERINETIAQAYDECARDTNHLIYTYNYASGDDYSNLNLDIFWDQEIGILTELSFQAEAQINGTYVDASAAWTIIESNVEDLPEFTQPTLILAIIATATVIAAIIKKKNSET